MSKRGTYLPARDTSPPLRGDVFEAARFLKDAARDFMNERESAKHVDFAVANWLATRERESASALRDAQEGEECLALASLCPHETVDFVNDESGAKATCVACGADVPVPVGEPSTQVRTSKGRGR